MKKILITLGLLLLVAVLKNNANAQEHGKWAIGHGDLTVDYVGSEWVFSFHHEDEDHDQTILLDQNSRNTIPDISRFDFLGKAGDPIWIIPQISTEGIPFMGFNSNLTAKGIFKQDSMNVHLTTVNAPGDFFIWTSSVNGEEVSMNSADGLGDADVMKFPARGHFHKNLGFSSPGTYLLGFTASGVLADSGQTVTSEEYFVKYELNVLSQGEVDMEIAYADGNKLGAELLAIAHDEEGDDHGDEHGDEEGDEHGAFEWAGVFSVSDGTHTWSMQKVGGAYADPTMRIVLIPTDSPTAETLEALEETGESLITGDAGTIIEDGETMTPVAGGSCFELHVGSGDDSTFTINTTGITGLAIYAQHVPTEFERDRHYLYDSNGTDIEPIAQEGGGGHHHHHGHGDLVSYAPSEVLLLVTSKAARAVPTDAAFSFLGQPGDVFYELPQNEEEGLLFLGIATDELEKGIFANDQVQMNLKSVTGPGEVYLYATDSFGQPNVFFNTTDGISEADAFVTKAGAHAHQSMAFSKPGTYTVSFDFSGNLAADGKETRSSEYQLVFEVEEGDEHGDEHGDDHGDDHGDEHGLSLIHI